MLATSSTAFSNTINLWHDFYLMVGTAAVTLLGLLFIAVSLNLRMMVEESHIELRARAVLTFNSFLYILAFALLFLIPSQTPAGLGWPLLGIGLLGTFTLSRNLWRVWQAPAEMRPHGPGFLLWRVILPIAWSIALIGVSVTVIAGSTGWLYWLVPVFIARLTAAVRNAWELLLHVGHDEARDERETAPAMRQ